MEQHFTCIQKQQDAEDDGAAEGTGRYTGSFVYLSDPVEIWSDMCTGKSRKADGKVRVRRICGMFCINYLTKEKSYYKMVVHDFPWFYAQIRPWL